MSVLRAQASLLAALHPANCGTLWLNDDHQPLQTTHSTSKQRPKMKYDEGQDHRAVHIWVAIPITASMGETAYENPSLPYPIDIVIRTLCRSVSRGAWANLGATLRWIGRREIIIIYQSNNNSRNERIIILVIRKKNKQCHSHHNERKIPRAQAEDKLFKAEHYAR